MLDVHKNSAVGRKEEEKEREQVGLVSSVGCLDCELACFEDFTLLSCIRFDSRRKTAKNLTSELQILMPVCRRLEVPDSFRYDSGWRLYPGCCGQLE